MVLGLDLFAAMCLAQAFWSSWEAPFCWELIGEFGRIFRLLPVSHGLSLLPVIIAFIAYDSSPSFLPGHSMTRFCQAA